MRANRRTIAAVLGAIVLLEIVHGIEEIVLLPHIFVETLGLGAAAVGLIISSYLFADLACRPPSGWLTDKFGRRNVLIAGMVLTVVIIPPMAVARDVPSLFLLNVLNGVGAGTMWPAVYALVADSYGRKERGGAMGVVNLFMLGGLASGPIIGNIIVNWISYTPAFFLCFVLAAIALVISVILLKDPARAVHEDDDPAPAGLAIPPNLVISAAVSVLAAFALAQLLPILNLFGRDALGLSPIGMAAVLGPAALITAGAIFPAGRLADRYGRKRPLVFGLLIMALPMTLSGISREPYIVAVGGLVAGLGYALAAPSVNALLLDYLPSGSRGLTAGIIVALQGVGIAFGPAVGGGLYESAGPYAPIQLSAAVLLFSAFLVILMKRERSAVRAMPDVAAG